MPKYWVKNYFAHESFPKVGQKQKTEEKKKEKGLNDVDNNGQATHGARMAHASRLGQNNVIMGIVHIMNHHHHNDMVIINTTSDN